MYVESITCEILTYVLVSEIKIVKMMTIQIIFFASFYLLATNLH